ncbi:NAD(P)-binding protein [Xylaria intraflava]|nr:NAD(P)-binding protein [Xylaria intraflava]
MSAAGYLKNVAILGATGRLGSRFVEELAKTGKHNITALTRDAGGKKLPDGVQVVGVDYSDEAALVAALKGKDFLAILLPATAPPQTHTAIVKAAAKAGVPYVMPNAYGSSDTHESTAEPGPPGYINQVFIDKLKECRSFGVNYISMGCGFWYDWSLAGGDERFGFDITSKKVTLFDDGNKQISVSTLQQCGRAFAALLSLPESGATPSLSDWKNKPLCFNSFRVSQREMLESVQRAQGSSDKDWAIRSEPSSKRVADGTAVFQKGDYYGMVKVMYSRHFYPGEDIGSESTMANEILGLPREDLDEVTKWVVEGVESGKQW